MSGARESSMKLNPKGQKWRKWLRRFARWGSNGLITTFLGFILTGLLAAAFAKQLDNWAKQREVDAANRTRAVDAVKEISDLLYERRVRSVMYASALEHSGQEAEVAPARRSYDDAFARWNTKLQSNMLRVREISGGLGSEERSPIEIQFRDYLGPRLNEANWCVYSAYLASISVARTDSKSNAEQTLKACMTADGSKVSIGQLHDVINECGYAFVNALYTSIQATNASRANAKKIANSMASKCKIGPGDKPI
jgi:hypothetical protein